MKRFGLRSGSCLLVAGALLLLGFVAQRKVAAQTANDSAKKLKVYISVDMEGVAGTVTADQLLPTGFEYERFRHFMTEETLAAMRAAKEAGAGEIVVSDSHGNGENLLIEEFPEECPDRARLAPARRNDGWPGFELQCGHFCWLSRFDDKSEGRSRQHTFSSAHYARVTLERKRSDRRRGTMRLMREQKGVSSYLCLWR